MNQNRRPSGMPTGGQFAPSTRDEAAVALTPPPLAPFTLSPGEDGETLVREFSCETHDGPGACTQECADLVAQMSGDEGVAFDPTGTSYPPPRPYETYEYDEATRASVCVTHVPEGQVLGRTLQPGDWVYLDGQPQQVDSVTSVHFRNLAIDFAGRESVRKYGADVVFDAAEPEDVARGARTAAVRRALADDAWEGHDEPLNGADLDRIAEVAARQTDASDAAVRQALADDAWEGHDEPLTSADLDRIARVAASVPPAPSEPITVESRDGRLHATCQTCGDQNDQPDKGLGRANLAAWRTRHQHLPEGS